MSTDHFVILDQVIAASGYLKNKEGLNHERTNQMQCLSVHYQQTPVLVLRPHNGKIPGVGRVNFYLDDRGGIIGGGYNLVDGGIKVKCADCQKLEENPNPHEPQFMCEMTRGVTVQWDGVPERKKACGMIEVFKKTA